MAAFEKLRQEAVPTDMEGTAREILEATEAVIAETGITRLSMRSVASRVGISLASLQYYYRTREDLVRSFFDYKAWAYAGQLEALLESRSRDPAAALRGTLRFLLRDALVERTGIVYTQIQALASHDRAARVALEAHMRVYRSLMELLVTGLRPDLPPGEVRARATALVALVEGFPSAAQRSDTSARDLDRLTERLADLALSLAAA